MFKRIIALALTLAMALTVAACKGNKGPVQGSTGNNVDQGVNLEAVTFDTEALLAQMPAELKNTKLVFLNWYDPDTREEKVVIDAFEEKTGIQVEYIIKSYSSYISELSGLVQTGQSPDVLRMKKPELGILKLLQPLSTTGFDFTGVAWDKQTMDIYAVGDNQYGMALLNTPFYLPSMMFYNTVVMDEMGFEDPWTLWKEGKWTWDKFTEMATEWVNQGTEYRGFTYYAEPLATTRNASFLKYDGTQYTMDLNDESTIKAYQKASEYTSKNIMTTGAGTDGFEDGVPKLLFAAMDATAVQSSSNYFRKVRLRNRLNAVPYPKWEDHEYYVPMMESVAYGIARGAKNAKAVPYFVAYMCNFANYDTSGTNFFYSEQAKEAYMDLLGRSNRAYYPDKNVFEYSGDIEYFDARLHKVDISQTNTWLQERSNIFQNSVDMYNTELQALAQPQQ